MRDKILNVFVICLIVLCGLTAIAHVCMLFVQDNARAVCKARIQERTGVEDVERDDNLFFVRLSNQGPDERKAFICRDGRLLEVK